LREASLEFLREGVFTQTASPCGTFSQFQSGPKPQLAEFGNRAAKRRIITATAAHKISAMRSRRLIGAYGQIIFLRYHVVDAGSITPKAALEATFLSLANQSLVPQKLGRSTHHCAVSEAFKTM
jgi:hypothetical protein